MKDACVNIFIDILLQNQKRLTNIAVNKLGVGTSPCVNCYDITSRVDGNPRIHNMHVLYSRNECILILIIFCWFI